jgi:hypothetical protein
VQELKAFVDCAAGRQPQPVATTELFATMAVIFAIERALATGQVVESKTIYARQA